MFSNKRTQTRQVPHPGNVAKKAFLTATCTYHQNIIFKLLQFLLVSAGIQAACLIHNIVFDLAQYNRAWLLHFDTDLCACKSDLVHCKHSKGDCTGRCVTVQWVTQQRANMKWCLVQPAVSHHEPSERIFHSTTSKRQSLTWVKLSESWKTGNHRMIELQKQ